jgi:hypothetical protein
MSMTRAECAALRVTIARLMTGPAWFDELPDTPELRAVVYELRKRTREWLSIPVRELQGLLPADQRITAAGMQALQLAAHAREHATAAAAPPAQAQNLDHSGDAEHYPAPSQALPEAILGMAPRQAAAPAAPGPVRNPPGHNRLGEPHDPVQCPWCLRHIDDCRCPSA